MQCRRSDLWLARVALALALGVFAAGCGQKKAPQQPPPPVEVGLVEQADVPLTIDTFGNCATVASVTIIPQVTGVLAKTLFTEGAFVKVGDPLFEIDHGPYQAALNQAQGNLETAKADFVNAQENLARFQKLYETKVVDVQDLQNAQATLTASEGNVIASEAALETAGINLGYCRITSPIGGKTGRYLVNTGNLVTANSSELVNIQTISPIYVDYTISEAEMPRIRRFLDAGGLDVEITIPGDPTTKATGKLEFVDNSINNQTGTLRLRATLPNDDQHLWPGLFVNVRLILTMLPKAIVAPATAVLVGQDGSSVFVLGGDNTVSLRPVTIGQREGDRIVIESGLQVGEKVITSGQIALAPGAKVAPVAANRPPVPAP